MANTRGFVPHSRRTQPDKGLVPVQVYIRPPWAGFTPDISHHINGLTGSGDWLGLRVYGEQLLTPDGFQQILANAVNPIFGNDDDAAGYTEVTTLNTWGTGVTASADQVQPIAVIGYYFDERGGAAAQHTSAFVITFVGTKQAPAVGPPHNEYNHFWTRDLTATTNLWVSREFVSNAIGTVDSPPRWTRDEPIDFAIWDLPIPNSVGDAVGPPVTAGSVVADPPVVLWCSLENGVTDGGGTVCYFPQATAGTTYSNMSSYATELDANALVVLTPGVQQDTDVRFGIGARSVTVFDGRALYLNTVETAAFVRRPRRVRWSPIGNPFILDQNYSGGTNNLEGVGAGFIDLDEFAGEGVKVEVLGDVVACYMEDGVAFLRRTQHPTAAFEREIVDRDRSLLGVRALVTVGDGLHFGIFADGWYYLDEAGRWKEAGVSPAEAAGGQSQRLFKWKENFYQQLNRAAAHKIALTYDQTRQQIKIAWPSGQNPVAPAVRDLNQVWTYDISNDRVYPDVWDDGTQTPQPELPAYASDRSPTCWGSVPADIHGVVSPSVWDQANSRIVVHGESAGLVYAHDASLTTFDGDTINWRLAFQGSDFGLDPFVVKTVDKVWVEYIRVGTDEAAFVDITIQSGGTAIDQNVTLQGAVDGGVRVARMVPSTPLRLAGHNFSITLAGTGRVRILSLRLQVLVEEGHQLGAQPLESGGVAI